MLNERNDNKSIVWLSKTIRVSFSRKDATNAYRIEGDDVKVEYRERSCE